MLTDPAQKDSPRGQTPRRSSGLKASPGTSAWSAIAVAASRTRYRRAMEEWAKDLSLPIETD